MKGVPQGSVLVPLFIIYISDLGLKITPDFFSIMLVFFKSSVPSLAFYSILRTVRSVGFSELSPHITNSVVKSDIKNQQNQPFRTGQKRQISHSILGED